MFTAFALMTAAAALAVLWPLGRTRALKGAREADLAVYRDQLAEIGRDRESGRLPPEQAEAARVEVARRMLAADAVRETGTGAATSVATWRRRAAAVAALVLIPAGAAGLYGLLGSPDVPGAPLAERLAAPPDRGDVAILVRRVEDHLAAHPDDGNGYEILAPVYLRLGRPEDAARAFGEAIRILGPTAERLSARGEALMVAADGLVTAEAQRAFKAALTLDPKEPRALFFTAVAAEQDGRPAEAAAIFRRMIAQAPAQAPYIPMVQAALARAEAEAGAGAAPAPGPSAADLQAAAALSAEDRSAMVRGMVDRLEARLAADPNDLDGWLRLARAFTVLGQNDKALGAINAARAAFKDNQKALGRIDAAEKDLARGG
ncbi:c-type cytochrome biogenesis protein CcmI [Xanthobacter sp. KR7-225]|uniref:c-type cytochrome biogenesis protein CcmI n=1 Tax=Xanthobacter sp. KR7-225 TaxID=3156613 RepID=UPI0032B4FECE